MENENNIELQENASDNSENENDGKPEKKR